MGCGAPLQPPIPTLEVRKTVTALFCDLVGSTTLAEQHDPEVLRPLLDRYFTAARGAVERHGGRVEKFIGDAVSAVFGVPVAHEDDALRAVRTAVEICDRMAAISAGSTIPLACRIGVTTGEVLIPGDGTPMIGDAMNTAARLQSAAEPGTILVGEPTYRLVRDTVAAEPLTPLVLKGKAAPVAAYRVLPDAPHSPSRTRRLGGPMIGRQRELDVLHQALGRAIEDGSCQLVTILGTAGVGKSRLMTEFLRDVPEPVRVLRGRCLPYGEGITYWAIAEIIREAAGIRERDDTDTMRGRIDALVAGLPEAPSIGRALASLSGLEASAGQEELVWALRRALEHMAEVRPLVVVVEDIHWAEPSLLDLLQSVAGLARKSTILVVCSARPDLLDDQPAWGRAGGYATSILLHPLTEGRALELIDSLVPGSALPPPVRARIAEAAEGNPLYVGEFIRMLIDDGALVADGNVWIAARDLESIAVPPTIQALLSARLDALSLDERVVAERASVVGRVFDEPAVIAMSPDDDRADVSTALAALVRKEFIRSEGSASGSTNAFRFRHILIRDAAYERLPKVERARLHEQFADWLEVTAGDRRLEADEIAGYHLEQAFRYRRELGLVDERARSLARRAAERLGAAGRRAYDRSDISAAVNLLARAVDVLEPDDPAGVEILPDLGRALDANGRFDESRACFSDALDRAAVAGNERALAHARVLQCLAFGAEVTLDERRRVADACEGIFERLGDDRGLALCWRLRGEASWREGKAAGDEAALARAFEYARRAGAHREEALIANGLSSGLALGPTPVPDAIRRCHEILAHAPDDRGIEMAMSHALAHLHARLGQFDLARTLAIRCREIAAGSGQPAEAAHLTEVEWDVATLAGDHEAAERIIAEGCAWFGAIGRPHPMLEAFLALSRVALGRAVDVPRLTAMAAEKGQATRGLLQAAIAGAQRNAGNYEEAEQSAQSAVDYFAGTDLITFQGEVTVILGDVLWAAGRHEEARTAFRRALDLYRSKGTIVGVATVERRLTG